MGPDGRFLHMAMHANPRAANWPAVFHPHCLCDLETFIARLPPQAGKPPQSDRHRRPLDGGGLAQRREGGINYTCVK